jgi:hypothetical protein
MKITALRGDLARATSGRALNQQQAASRATVQTMLDTAADATHRRPGRIRGAIDLWRGTSVATCHSSLHAARIALVDLLGPDEVDTLLPAAMARVGASLSSTDVRRVDLETRLSAAELSLLEKRAALKSALQIGYDASDQLYQRVRSFRNILIIVGATILVFMGVMIGLVALSPGTVPMCFEPSITASQAQQSPNETTATRTVCPSGEQPVGSAQVRQPSPQDIAIVAGLGLVGGALAAALAIRNLRGTSLPFDVPLALAFLKVPMGALTAVVGIVLLGGGFVPGLSELDSQRQILAYALLLGYAQQVGTQLIDKQAQNLLNSVPSKDPEGKQYARPHVWPRTSAAPEATPPGPRSTSNGRGAPIATH